MDVIAGVYNRVFLVDRDWIQTRTNSPTSVTLHLYLFAVPNWPPSTCDCLGGQLNGCIVAWALKFRDFMNRFGVRFGSFGASPFAFQQMLYPFLSFLVLSASLARYDTSFAIHACLLLSMYLWQNFRQFTSRNCQMDIWLCSAQGPREPHRPMCTCKMDVKSWQMEILLLISHNLNQQHPLNGLWNSCVMSDEQTLKTENDNICSCLNIYLFLDPKIRFIILFQKRYLGNLSKEKLV